MRQIFHQFQLKNVLNVHKDTQNMSIYEPAILLGLSAKVEKSLQYMWSYVYVNKNALAIENIGLRTYSSRPLIYTSPKLLQWASYPT